MKGRQADVTGQAQALALGFHGQGVVEEIPPYDGRQPIQSPAEQVSLRGTQLDNTARAVRQGEGHLGVRHAQAVDDIRSVLCFRARTLEELEPRRRGIEQVPHFHPRTALAGSRFGRGFHTPLNLDAPGAVSLGGAAGQAHARHRADGRQSLAAKAQETDVEQVLVRQLGGCVPLHGQRQFVGRHATAVVLHRDERPTAFRQGHVDTARASVDGVLHQLLHGRGRPFHHLARGDLVDEGGGRRRRLKTREPFSAAVQMWAIGCGPGRYMLWK